MKKTLFVYTILIITLSGCLNTPPESDFTIYWNSENTKYIELDENNSATLTWETSFKITFFFTSLDYSVYSEMSEEQLLKHPDVVFIASKLNHPKSLTCEFDSGYLEVKCIGGNQSTEYLDITGLVTELPLDLHLGVIFYDDDGDKLYVTSQVFKLK